MPLPPGVTLQPIDGGASYYADSGFTYAANAGWDDPGFFPVGVWYGQMHTQADADRWADLSLNTSFRVTADSDMSLFRSNGIWTLVAGNNDGTLENPGAGSETTGLITYDEPTVMYQWESVVGPTPAWASGTTYITNDAVSHGGFDYLSAGNGNTGNTPPAAGGSNAHWTGQGTAATGLANATSDGRFFFLGNTWNFIAFGGISPDTTSPQVLATTVATPDSALRGIDMQEADIYWFAGIPAGVPHQGGIIYGLPGDMTSDQCQRGSHYGDMVDQLRGFQQAASRNIPIAQLVENGGPFTQDTTGATYITPPQMNWGTWSSIIHGARAVVYFNHSFGGPAISDDNFAGAYYQTVQSGQSTSIYAQAKATNALIAELASVINAETAIGYIDVDPPPTVLGPSSSDSGIDTLVKYTGDWFYVFACTRDSQAATGIAATFTVTGSYTGTVTVVGEDRTLTATGGVFTDTFAVGTDVHIYQIAAPMTLLTNSFEGGTSGTAITTGNSGGASGDAFDSVDGTPAYSNTHAANGTLSAKLPAGSSNQALWWNSSLTGSSLAQVWFRLYGYLSAYPTSSPTIIEPRYAGGIAAFVIQESDGTLTFADHSGTPVFRTSTSLPTGAWWRIEGFVTGDASAGQVELKVFLNPGSATPTETKTSSTSVNTGGPITAMRYGQVMEFGGNGVDMWVDDLGASDIGYIGPVPPPAPSGKRHSGSPVPALTAAMRM